MDENINPKKLELKKIRMTCDQPMGVDAPLPDSNPFMLLVGPPGSGKTNLLMNLFTVPGRFYNKKFDRVHIFSPSLHTLKDSVDLPPDRLHNEFGDLAKVLADIEKERKKQPNFLTAIIFDDFSHAFKPVNNKEMLRLAQNRRHLGVSLFIVGQKLSKIPLELRASANALCWFFNMNRREQDALYEEFLGTLDPAQFRTLMQELFTDPHDFIFVDLQKGHVYRNFIDKKI